MKSIPMSLALLAVLTLMSCSENKQDSLTVEAKVFADKLDSKKEYILLDVRSPEEFAANHLANAKNININESSFTQQAALLDKNKTVLVYCKSGARSSKAATQLQEMGFAVHELQGGMLSWQAEGFPVEADIQKAIEDYTMTAYNEAILTGKIVLVDFHAVWCPPCKMMAPHIDAMKAKYGDQLVVLKVDTDKSVEVAKHFKINAIPLVKLYKNGVEVYDKTGYHSIEDLEALLNQHI